MTLKLKAAGRYCSYTTAIGALLSIIALIVVISQSGLGRPSLVCTILVYLAYWPMLLTGWSTHNLFVSFWVLPANLIGWSLVGFLYGLLRTAAK
jgi:hypothetical protein